jgi:hypothetical protein
MTQQSQDDLLRRSNKAIVSHAFFRLESALTIGATLLLAFFLPQPFGWWQWWYWMVLGGASEAAIVYSSITDERTAQRVMAKLLQEKYDPRTIKTEKYRQAVIQALEYRSQIEQTVATTPTAILRSHLASSTAAIGDWIEHIFTIAQRLDTYARDELLHRDRKALPASIARLRQALDSERNPDVRQQIETTMRAKREQRQNLEELQDAMEKAEFVLEETLSALGTVYSQFQLIRAQKLSGSRAKELSTSIDDQVDGLQDIIQAMNTVYGKS